MTRPFRYAADLAGFLRRRWYLFVALLIVGSYMAWFAQGVIADGKDRRAARARIEALAVQIKDQNDRITDQNAVLLRIASDIENATSPEAQARSAATLAQAIADIRRSMDCVGLDIEAYVGRLLGGPTDGVPPPPCSDVNSRLDALRAGLDPFTPPKGP